MDRSGALDQLAGHYGIEPEFKDNWGQQRVIPAATKLGLLAAMGVPVADAGEVAQSLQIAEAATWREVLAPVAVIRHGAEAAAVVTLPAEPARRLGWTVRLEDGSARSGEAVAGDLSVIVSEQVEGTHYQRLNLPLPDDLPEGYHSLELVAAGHGTHAMTLAVAPLRALIPADLGAGTHLFGITAPLYGMRSAQNWGIGDFADLGALARMMASERADLVGVNPVHALFPALPDRISPYSPSSRRFLNVLMISVDAAAALDWGADSAVPLTDSRAEIERLRAMELVDYPAIARLKLGALERLHDAVSGGSSPALAAFRAYQAEQGPSLERQALFDALLEHFVAADPALCAWRAWPEGFRRPDGEGARAFARQNARRVEFYQFLQWLAAEQLAAAQAAAQAAGMTLGLYIDLAVGVDPAGADAWAEPEVVASGVRIGAPPDDFSPKGQDWGLAPLAPHALRAQAYTPFLQLLRQGMRHAGALRIDHVLGLRRSYWLPPERELPGAYVTYPLDDLLGLIALESKRHGCVVIGEDLGTVPEGFREILSAAGLLGCRVLYFEQDQNGAFRSSTRYPSTCLASISTHDLPTLAGFWVARDVDWRERLGLFGDPHQAGRDRVERGSLRTRVLQLLAAEGLLPEGLDPAAPPTELPWSVVEALHALLASSPAAILVMQLEDALGVVEQPNLPGTISEHPNWRRKLEVPIEGLAREPQVRSLIATIRAARAAAAR